MQLRWYWAVFRTDVKSYYASIDHLKLLDQVAVYIKDRLVMNLIGQYLRRTSERGGCFWAFEKGISLGCPLSPLIGAFFLSAVDDTLEKTGLFYIRFMDDILVLAPSRWKLRRAVRTVNQALASLAVEKHPDKTFIGRIERGFDFLGYHYSRAGLTIARKTIANFIKKASRLYEQKRSTVLADAALEMYVKRWTRWASSGFETASMGSHQHAWGVRFLRRKAPRHPRNPTPEKSGLKHTLKQEEQKRGKAKQITSMQKILWDFRYLCWDKPNSIINFLHKRNIKP
jgi:hypothetical protein